MLSIASYLQAGTPVVVIANICKTISWQLAATMVTYYPCRQVPQRPWKSMSLKTLSWQP